MDTKTRAHAAKLMFTCFSCLAALTMSALACDSDAIDTTSDVDQRAAPLDTESHPLISETPDPIEGLDPVGFDEELQAYVFDRDEDGFPDVTEVLEGTDIFDPESNPAFDGFPPDAQEAGFPLGTCRPGFRRAGARLCITENVQDARPYRTAAIRCRDLRSNVCSYEDLSYLYLRSSLDSSYNPNGRWIGNLTADDNALCGNRSITYNGDPDWANFEGTCHKNDVRNFWCCHDDE